MRKIVSTHTQTIVFPLGVTLLKYFKKNQIRVNLNCVRNYSDSCKTTLFLINSIYSPLTVSNDKTFFQVG